MSGPAFVSMISGAVPFQRFARTPILNLAGWRFVLRLGGCVMLWLLVFNQALSQTPDTCYCPTPVLNLSDISTSGFKVSWEPVQEATLYRVYPFMQLSAAGTDILETHYKAMELEPCAVNWVFVHALCVDECPSIRAKLLCVTLPTLDSLDLTGEVDGGGDALLRWRAAERQTYDLRWKYAADTAWGPAWFVVRPPYRLSGLRSCDTVEVQLRAACPGNDAFSPWSAVLSLALPCAPAPVGRLSLYPNPGRGSYSFMYRHSGGGLARLRVYAPDGHLLIDRPERLTPSEHRFEIELPPDARGACRVEFEHGGRVHPLRVFAD